MLLTTITTDIRNTYYKYYHQKNKISFRFGNIINKEQLDELSTFMSSRDNSLITDGYNCLLGNINPFNNNKYNKIRDEINKLTYKVKSNILNNVSETTYQVIKILKDNSSDGGYIVGGSVRDNLLGLTPKDYDFTTETDVNLLMPIFKKYGFSIKEVGLQFSVLIVSKSNEEFEIANFRKDSKNSDG